MEGLLVAILASALYAVAISFGVAREFDNRIVLRPFVVAGGIAIVVIARLWGEWAEVGQWAVWFSLAAIPQVIRVAVIHINEDKKKKLKSAGIGGEERVDDATSP